MDKTTLSIAQGLHRRIKESGRQDGRAQAVVIRHALEDYLDRQEELPLLSFKGRMPTIGDERTGTRIGTGGATPRFGYRRRLCRRSSPGSALRDYPRCVGPLRRAAWRDANHRRVSAALPSERRPFLIPSAILGEIAELIEPRLTPVALALFLADLARGGFVLDCGENDLVRIGELVRPPSTSRSVWSTRR